MAKKDAEVADVMYEHGALALISLDGYMALDIETDALAAGDSVTVALSDGEELTGTVETVVGGKATILVTDNGPGYDEAVTVLNSEGTELGTGNLYIHSALRVTGYAGTIASVKTSLNAKVSDSTKLFTLEDTGYSANYNSLLRQRAELEETLLELLTIQRDGALLAKMNGSVYSVDHSDDAATAVVTLSADEKMSVTISVDEADILSLDLGQTVTVSVSSVSEDSFLGTLTEINRTSYNEEYQEYGGKVDVVTGLENSTYVEIKSGLSVGDTVYYTEQESQFGFGSFGSMPGGMGSFPGGSGSGMPDFGGSGMPDFGGMMPGFGGGFENFASDAETRELEIGDVHISLEIEGGKATGSMEDIQPGAFVTVTLNSKGKVTNVLVSPQSFSFVGGRSVEN